MKPEEILEMQTAMASTAAMIREYYESLIAEGFSKEEALILTAEYQKAFISAMFLRKQND